MFFLWGKSSGYEKLDEGYINCPNCRKRKPASLTKHVESSHMYFIPTGSTEGPEQVQCKDCGGYFANNSQVAFSKDMTPPDWNCFKCKGLVPHARIECPHCGFRFTS